MQNKESDSIDEKNSIINLKLKNAYQYYAE